MLDVAYVGNNTIHLQGEEDLNQPPPNLYLSTNVTHGNYIVGKGLDLNAPCNAAMQCSLTSELNRIRPYLGWGPINYESTRYFADYNGLQVFLQHHQGKDLVMAVSYTFSKALANSGGPAIVNSGQVQYDPQNRLDLQSEWGPTVLDRRQIFSVHGVYKLPAHTSWHGFVGGAANGWEISTIIQLTSGVWLTPTVQGNDPAGLGGGAVGSNAQLRPQQLGDPNHGPQTQAQWFNIDEYNAQPPQGTIGDARVGSVLGPGYENVTLDVFKTFELPHAARLQIRCETFNAFNHVNWKNVSMTDNPGPGFGQVTTAYDNRTMQLGAKILF